MKEPKRIWDDNASAVTPCNTSEYLIQTIFHCSVISFAILCQFEHFWNIWPSAVGGKLPFCKQEFGMKMLLLLNCQTLNKSAASAQTLQKRCWCWVSVCCCCWLPNSEISEHDEHEYEQRRQIRWKCYCSWYARHWIKVLLLLRHSKSDAGSRFLFEWLTDQGRRWRLLWVPRQVCISCISFVFVCVFV